MSSAEIAISVPEKNKIEGLCYAVSSEGIELPVIDITHPCFRVSADEGALAAMAERTLSELRRGRTPRSFVKGMAVRLLLRGSVLASGIKNSKGTFLSGMKTYLLKLGPENLGSGWAKDIDRAIAASLPCLSMRIRLEQTARLLADGLLPALKAMPGRGVHILNIAGGPSMDSLSALILLRRESPDALLGRRIRIHVLDADGEGPRFAARSLKALSSEHGPLHGLDLSLRYVEYDWSATDTLRYLLENLSDEEAVMAGSSEGGLFEYGTDEKISANLEALRYGVPENFVFVGSVGRNDELSARLNASTKAAVRLWNFDRFSDLVRSSGWAVSRALDAPLSRQVTLERALERR